MIRAIPVILIALLATALAGCGSFDSRASGERLIRDYVSKNGQGNVTLRSVSCPGGISQHAGRSYNCSITLYVIPTRTAHSGTITIHMEAGNKVAINGRRDVHVS